MKTGIASLSQNDKMIIEHLFRVKVSTIYQLLRDCPTTYKDRSYLARRLSRLVRSEYLEKFWHEKRRVYTLGKKGLECLAVRGLLHHSWSLKYVKASPYQLDHDLLLADIYVALGQLPVVTAVQTHNQLLNNLEDKQSSHNIPDVLITLDPEISKRKVALELELTLKDKKRYEMTFDNYYDSTEIGAVLYLVPEPHYQKMLVEIDDLARLGEKSRIFSGRVSDFRKSPADCPFTSSDGRVFRFGSLSGNKRPLPSKKSVVDADSTSHSTTESQH